MMMMKKLFFYHKLKGLGTLNKKYINRQYWKDKQVAIEITMVLRTVSYLVDYTKADQQNASGGLDLDN